MAHITFDYSKVLDKFVAPHEVDNLQAQVTVADEMIRKGTLRLHIEIGGEHCDVKVTARGGQLESNDDFVAKLVDAVVLHIFD